MDAYGTSLRNTLLIGIGTIAIAVMCVWTARSAEEGNGSYGLGRAANEEEMRAWNIDVSGSGEGLPPGRGTVKQGADVYAVRCAMCHGPTGTEGPKDKLVGGHNTLATPKPVKTVWSYWPYAPTLYDYIYRAMPFTEPQSLTSDDVYSVIAWLLYQNKIVQEDAVIDARTLPLVRMPNRDGFIPDPRPDVRK